MTTAEDEAVVRDYMARAAALGPKAAGDEYLEIWAEDGVLEQPYLPDPAGRLLEGKNRIATMIGEITGAGPSMLTFEFLDVDLRPTGRAGEFVAEMRSEAEWIRGGTYTNRYCAIAQVRDGKMVLWREYYDPNQLST